MSSEAILPLVTATGGGFLSGILLGYFVKKIIKILMFVFGGILALLLYLQYQGIITINVAKFESSLQSFTISISPILRQLSDKDYNTTLGLPLTASISAGFVLGFIKS